MAIMTNTIGYTAPGFVETPLNFPGTRRTTTLKAFKKRLRDPSLLPMITTIWGDKLEKGSTEYLIPVLPILETYKTKPGDKVKYNIPKTSNERFIIGRERAWGLHIIQEDEYFSAFDINSPILAEQLLTCADDIEAELLSDIINKCASFNTGNTAGWLTKKVALGSATTPITLYPDGVPANTSNASTPLRYIQGGVNCLRQYKGARSLTNLRIICNIAVADALQADDRFMKADGMGDAKSVIRGDVYSLGRVSGADIYVSNALPTFVDGSGNNVYPVLFLDKSAIAYHDEMKIDERNLTDIDYWGTFARSKLVYDWFLQYPERFAVGYVKIA